LAKSVLAAVTARIIAFGFEMNRINMSRICFSISRGWSPTGTLVRPGRSTSVRVRTLGEKILRLIGFGEIPVVSEAEPKSYARSPAFFPVIFSVSRTISSLIL